MKIDLKLIEMSPEMTYHVMKMKEKLERILDIIGFNIKVALEAEINPDGSLTVSAKPDCDDSDVIEKMNVNFLHNKGWKYL